MTLIIADSEISTIFNVVGSIVIPTIIELMSRRANSNIDNAIPPVN